MNRAGRRWRIWAGLFILAGLATPGFAQLPNDDPVEALRELLASPGSPEVRTAEVGQCIDALRTLDDLRRALMLSEWHSFYQHGAGAVADEAARQRVAQRFVRVVRNALTRADVEGQVAVIELLGSVGEKAKPEDFAAMALRSLGRDVAERMERAPERVRAAAARTLGLIHADPVLAVPAFSRGLTCPSASVRRAAAEGLRSQLADLEAMTKATTPNTSAVREALAVCRIFLPVCCRALQDPELRVRRCCSEIVGTFIGHLGRLTDHIAGDEERVSQLRTMLIDCSACSAALSKALSDADCDVQANAARAFEEMGLLRRRWSRLVEEDRNEEDPLLPGLRSALPTLRLALNSVNVVTRRRVVEVLEMIGPEARTTTPLLIHALSDTDRFVRWVAVRALSATPLRPSADLVAALSARLQDVDLDIRRAAARGLEQAARRPVTDAPIRVIPTGADQSESALATAVMPLWRALLSSEASLRLEALQALRQMGPAARSALPVAVELLGDSDARVRQHAAELLGSLGAEAQAALPVLQRAAEDEVPEVRHAAREAVVKIRGRR